MSTSITKNRLLHLSDLPNIQKYSPIDINKLLPIHYSTLKDNVLTMIHYESVNFKSKILLHDPNLTINSTSYSQIKGGWCEDFDEKDDTTSVTCIKKSIEIGVLILNYLEAMCQATIKHRHREQQSEGDSCQIISKGECFTRSKAIDNQEILSSRISMLSQRINKHQEEKQQRIQTSFNAIDFEKEHECFENQQNITIAYNIYKKNKKYIFLTGVNQCFTINFFNSVLLYRQWNLERLKANHQLAMSYEKLGRINVYFEHLFSISRGFIFSSLQARKSRLSFAPVTDPNDNKKHLKALLSYFEISKDLQNSSELIFQQLKHNQSQIFTVLENTLKVYRFCFTYKMDSESQEQKNSFMIKLTSQFSKVLSEILTSLPINVNVSYCFQSVHDQNTNQVVLQMMFNYKSSAFKQLFLTSEEVGLCLKNLAGYLNRQHYEQVQKTQRNVADEVFKSSYLIFSKYNQIVENSEAGESFHKELKAKLSQVRLTGSQTKTDSLSQLNPSTSKRKIFDISGSKQQVLSQSSTIFSKSPGYSQIEVGYKKLLKSIEQRYEFDCILNPIKLRSCLKDYLQPFLQINTVQALQKDESQSLWFLGISNQVLQAEDIYNLMMKFEDNSEAICEYFMQENSFQKMVEVAKLFGNRVQQMFKEYLSLGEGFKNFRYNLVTCFLKRLLQKYFIKASQNPNKVSQSSANSPIKNSLYISPQKRQPSMHPELDLKQLNMEDLIYLLQRKTYNCTEYKNLILAFIQEIFCSRKQTSYISQILYSFYIHLLNNDHHQDLVASFIGDLFYEVVFFTNEITSLTLNNSRYRKNVVDLKEKKFYEVIREGGFINFGFHVRNLLIPELVKAKQIVEYEHLIVSTIRIERPNYFKAVIKMIQGSFFSNNFTLLAQIIQQKDIYFDSINRNICMPFYPKQLQQDIQTFTTPSEQLSKPEQNDALSNIDFSQSGIFKQLISLNPDIKIAGMSLKEEYSRKIKQREEQEQKFTVAYFLEMVAKVNVEEAWEYIQLVLQFKDKVVEMESVRNGLQIDPELEKGLIYIKETFQHIYSKLSNIYNYIGLSDVVYQIGKTQLSSKSLQ